MPAKESLNDRDKLAAVASAACSAIRRLWTRTALDTKTIRIISRLQTTGADTTNFSQSIRCVCALSVLKPGKEIPLKCFQHPIHPDLRKYTGISLTIMARTSKD
jgi:hypothetical protein